MDDGGITPIDELVLLCEKVLASLPREEQERRLEDFERVVGEIVANHGIMQ